MSPDVEWVWSTGAAPSPSCTSPSVTNDAKMCEGDLTSVVLQGNGQAQCLAAKMDECKFNMRNFEKLNFDINMIGCGGTWAAPLWLTPDYWNGGGESGEIDMLENCPNDAVHSNFAGGGTPKTWTFANPNSFQGHVTMWKKDSGNIYVSTCSSSDLTSKGQCHISGAAFYANIYNSNACKEGDCIYSFVSDIWNGYSGDGGWQYCAQGKVHESSGCSTSITNIRIEAASGTFSGKCAALVASSPSPSPSPEPPSPPTPTPSPLPHCDVGEPVLCPNSHSLCAGNQCCPDGSVCPSADDSWDQCDKPKGDDCTKASGSWSPCGEHSGEVCCNPHVVPAEFCPGNVICQSCGGGDACHCPNQGLQFVTV